MGVTDRLRQLRWEVAGHYSRPLAESFSAGLDGVKALEVGGPTPAFRAGGLLEMYPLFSSVDNVQWAEDTVWHGEQQAGVYAPDEGVSGEVLITDDVGLPGTPDGTYGAVIHSHVIEHLANPLRALRTWHRILADDGALVMVAPHGEGTFDHLREVTSLEHMVGDYENETGEDDLTHLDETLELHDRTRGAEQGDDEEWSARRRDNLNTRLIHHHVFTGRSLLPLIQEAGFEITALEIRYPHDIWLRAEKSGGMSDAELELAFKKSPFKRDRAR
jgi:SAM-dependent methyltransferase